MFPYSRYVPPCVLRLKNVGRSVELGKKTEFGMTAWIQYRLRKG